MGNGRYTSISHSASEGFKRHFHCRPAHENFPRSILEWLANNTEKKNTISLASFTYHPAHVLAWHMSLALQEAIPAEILSRVIAMQRAGAAALSSFERLGDLRDALEEDEQKRKLEAGDGEHNMQHPTAPTPLASHSATSDLDDVTSISTGATAGSDESSDSNDSFCSDMTSRTTIPSRPSSTLVPTEKIPALSLTHSDSSNVSSISATSFKQSNPSYIAPKTTPLTTMTIPMESTPARARYSAERYHLRTEALARLSHCVLVLDMEFSKYTKGHDQDNSNLNTDFVMDESVYDEFEEWYRGKKAAVRALEDRGRALEVERLELNADSPHDIK